jgi:hypothetical protein
MNYYLVEQEFHLSNYIYTSIAEELRFTLRLITRATRSPEIFEHRSSFMPARLVEATPPIIKQNENKDSE